MVAFDDLTELVSASLCGSWQEASWLSWLLERLRAHPGMPLCLLHCQLQSSVKVQAAGETRTEEEDGVKTGVRSAPELWPPLSSLMLCPSLNDQLASVFSHKSTTFRLKLDFRSLALVIFAFGSALL